MCSQAYRWLITATGQVWPLNTDWSLRDMHLPASGTSKVSYPSTSICCWQLTECWVRQISALSQKENIYHPVPASLGHEGTWQHRGQAAPPNCAGARAPATLGTESTSKRTNTADIHLPVQPYSHVECLKQHGTAKRFFTALIWFTGRFSKHFTHVHPQMSWVKSIPF